MSDEKPDWGCSQWGQHEHDWLDCPRCLDAYEKYLEDDHEEEGMSASSRHQLSDQQAALRQMLFDYGAIQRGEFTLASGKKSDLYVNMKKILMVPRVIDLIGRIVYDWSKGLAIDAIGGMESAAIPIATSAVLAYHKDCQFEARPHGFYVRKEAKKHGTGDLIEGRVWADDRVLIVEDVTTTGESAKKAIDACEARGALIVGVVTVVDRQEGAAEAFANRWFRPMLTRAQLGIDS